MGACVRAWMRVVGAHEEEVKTAHRLKENAAYGGHLSPPGSPVNPYPRKAERYTVLTFRV